MQSNKIFALRLFFSITAVASYLFVSAQSTAIEQSMERQGMVGLQTVDPSIRVSLMYGRADNFTGRVLYSDLRHAYLSPRAANALAKAQRLLKQSHPELSLKVYDAARPMRIQQRMRNAVEGTSKRIYVSNPKHGGGLHNYGLAVDITLCNARGDSLPMGTRIDYMGAAAHIDRETSLVERGRISSKARRNRQLLRRVMRQAGFKPLKTEWWHFNYLTRAELRRRRSQYPVIR